MVANVMGIEYDKKVQLNDPISSVHPVSYYQLTA